MDTVLVVQKTIHFDGQPKSEVFVQIHEKVFMDMPAKSYQPKDANTFSLGNVMT